MVFSLFGDQISLLRKRKPAYGVVGRVKSVSRRPWICHRLPDAFDQRRGFYQPPPVLSQANHPQGRLIYSRHELLAFRVMVRDILSREWCFAFALNMMKVIGFV